MERYIFLHVVFNTLEILKIIKCSIFVVRVLHNMKTLCVQELNFVTIRTTHAHINFGARGKPWISSAQQNSDIMEPEPLYCKILKKYLPRLASTLDPSVIATELHSVDVIDDRVWEEARKEAHGANYDRCLNVLEALIRSTRAAPECFDKFCTILEDQEVTKSLAVQLREELKKVEKEVAKGPLENSEYVEIIPYLLIILKNFATCRGHEQRSKEKE